MKTQNNSTVLSFVNALKFFFKWQSETCMTPCYGAYYVRWLVTTGKLYHDTSKTIGNELWNSNVGREEARNKF